MAEFCLYNGLCLPQIGFGTYKIPDGEPVATAAAEACRAGYGLLDTASFYGNEGGIGRFISSLAESEEPMIQTKVWNREQGYRETHEAFERSRDKLGVIDLYLIHWPVPGGFIATWKAMEEIYSHGEVKAIGVCNFQIHHLEALREAGKIRPMVNQIELHPRLAQEPVRHYCAGQGILVQGWRPLMKGTVGEIEGVAAIARSHGKEASQVALRWQIERGIMPLVKSVTPERIRSNRDIFDFSLTDEEVRLINSCDTGTRLGPDPDRVDF